jgi:hypothetical protein
MVSINHSGFAHAARTPGRSRLSTTPTAIQEEALAKAVMSPVEFAREILQSDITDIQARILDAVANHDRVACRSCHASGKSYVSACAVLWWLARWPDCCVIVTAPTNNQLRRILFGEIHAAIYRAKD